MHIAPLRRTDIDAVCKIYASVISPAYISHGEIAYGFADSKKFLRAAGRKFRQEITGVIGKRNNKVYVAYAQEKIAGFISAEVKTSPAGHKECWVLDMGVSAPFRKQGIGKKLISAAFAFGAKHKVKYFLLESGRANHSAHRFFQKEGFRPLNLIFIKESRPARK